jgi:hypothetical protein
MSTIGTALSTSLDGFIADRGVGRETHGLSRGRDSPTRAPGPMVVLEHDCHTFLRG